MFDNTQKIETKTIDERILPMSGFINISRVAIYVDGRNYSSMRDEIVKELEKHNIPIFKIGKNNENWLVRLEDLKPILIK